MKIEEMEFSVRTYNCLKRKGIDTVEQLAGMSDDDLMAIRCFGIGCLKEVHRKLGKEESIRPVIPGPAAKVVHGRWIYGTRAAVCSVCGFERNLDDNFGAAIACPNCGAKMDLKGE